MTTPLTMMMTFPMLLLLPPPPTVMITKTIMRSTSSLPTSLVARSLNNMTRRCGHNRTHLHGEIGRLNIGSTTQSTTRPTSMQVQMTKHHHHREYCNISSGGIIMNRSCSRMMMMSSSWRSHKLSKNFEKIPTAILPSPVFENSLQQQMALARSFASSAADDTNTTTPLDDADAKDQANTVKVEKVKLAACGDIVDDDDAADSDDDDDDDEIEMEDMFVDAHPSFDHKMVEWGGPRRGGRFPEPTRYGDWERKGRCSDF